MFEKLQLELIQLKPLNVITLGQTKSDNINRMITITDHFYIVMGRKKVIALLTGDYIKRLSLHRVYKGFGQT